MSWEQQHHLITRELLDMYAARFKDINYNISKASKFNLLPIPAQQVLENGRNVAPNVHNGGHLDSYSNKINSELARILYEVPEVQRVAALDRLVATLHVAVANGDLKTNRIYFPDADKINKDFNFNDYDNANKAKIDSIAELIRKVRASGFSMCPSILPSSRRKPGSKGGGILQDKNLGHTMDPGLRRGDAILIGSCQCTLG